MDDPWVCPNCGASLEELFSDAIRRVVGIGGRIFACPRCPPGYNRFGPNGEPTEESLALRSGVAH